MPAVWKLKFLFVNFHTAVGNIEQSERANKIAKCKTEKFSQSVKQITTAAEKSFNFAKNVFNKHVEKTRIFFLTIVKTWLIFQRVNFFWLFFC